MSDNKVCEDCLSTFKYDSELWMEQWDMCDMPRNNFAYVAATKDKGFTLTHACAAKGHLACLEKVCIANSFSDINNHSNDYMNTPMHMAVGNKRIDIINYLLMNGANASIHQKNVYGFKVANTKWFCQKIREGVIVDPKVMDLPKEPHME